MSGAGILADTTVVECIDCSCLLVLPARLANEAPGPLCFGCRSTRTEKESARAAKAVQRGQDKPTTRGK